MKIVDIIFALISGYAVGWVAREFLAGYGIEIGFFYSLLLHYIIPVFALLCLWVAFLTGKKFLFVFQAAKHLLVGAFVTVVDLKVFEFLVWIFSLFVAITPVFSKIISFLIAGFIKYWGNKYWAFERHERENIVKEMFQFFIATIVGLMFDIGLFYYFTEITGPQFAIPGPVWLKLSVIVAGASAAIWNFTAYKFFVFKK